MTVPEWTGLAKGFTMWIVKIEYTDGNHDCVFFNERASVGFFVADTLCEKNIAKVEILTEQFKPVPDLPRRLRTARDAFEPMHWPRR